MAKFPLIKTDICVIGGGSGGLSVAAACGELKVPCVLVEQHRLGGDCLWTGCVPSKTLLAAARQRPGDWPAAQRQVARAIAAIEPHDSPERFRALGVAVIFATARFISPRQIAAGDQIITARHFVLATGGAPAVPSIPGLDAVPYLTNRTIFQISDLPAELLVLGAGPIGLELGQAFQQLGSKVTMLEAGALLPREDAEAAALLRQQIQEDGIALHEQTRIERVSQENGRIILHAASGVTFRGTHLLVATGRRAELEPLHLPVAKIKTTNGYIAVDDQLRTSNRRISALGDCIGPPFYTHKASAQASVLVRRLLYRLPSRNDDARLPRAIYTSPELAQLGQTAAEAQVAGAPHQVITIPYARNDRAIAENATRGLIKLVVGRDQRVRGVTICGLRASELLPPWQLIMQQRQKLSAMTGIIPAYTTLSEISRTAASAFYRPLVFGPLMQFWVRMWRWLG